jgi:hypothetical protein
MEDAIFPLAQERHARVRSQGLIALPLLFQLDGLLRLRQERPFSVLFPSRAELCICTVLTCTKVCFVACCAQVNADCVERSIQSIQFASA